MKVSQQSISVEESGSSFWGDLLILTKARLITLVLVTTFIGFCLGSEYSINWIILFHTLLGSGLVACGAATFNQIIERAQDRLMDRTKDRPLAAERMEVSTAWILGLFFTIGGLLYMLLTVNRAATLLTAATWVTYVAVYTPTKRKHSICTLLGAISGGLPPVIGWYAAGRHWDTIVWFLFGLLYFWQLPHFAAINWVYRGQYERAGFTMWSNGDRTGMKSASIAVGFSIVLFLWTLLPFYFPVFGTVYLITAGVLGVGMLFLAVAFMKNRSRRNARILFFYTLLYLPLVLGVALMNRI